MEQGLAIRQARLARNMTQAHLAGLAGVSEKTVRRAEAGDNIRPDSVRALCAALELDASRLRSEAEMNPAEAHRREAILSRQVWASRSAILSLAFGCVAGPLVPMVSETAWFRSGAYALLVTVAIMILTGVAIGIACFAPAVTRVLAAAPAVAWLLARREAAFLAATIAFCTFWLCSLPFAAHDFVTDPSYRTGHSLAVNLLVLGLSIAPVAWLVTLKDVAFPPEAERWAARGIGSDGHASRSGPTPATDAPPRVTSIR